MDYRSIRNKAEFVYSSLNEAVKETVEKLGVPTKRSYWREHPVDAALTIASVAAGLGTGACVAYVLADEDFRHWFWQHELTEDTTLIPPHRHERPSSSRSDLDVRIPRPMNLGDYLSLAAPVMLFAAPLIIEGVRYHRWKKSKDIAKSIQKDERKVQ